MNYNAGIVKRNKCRLKKGVSRIVLFFLYRAFQALYKYDSNIRREIDGWSPGFAICMRTAARGPFLCLIRTGDGIKRQREAKPSELNLEIEFKSIDAAFLVFTGQIGVAQAYAQHRFTLRGSINECMSFVRCVDTVEAYLFPAFITKRILKAIPKKQVSPLTVYRYALMGF
jgi:hypothetical protein